MQVSGCAEALLFSHPMLGIGLWVYGIVMSSR